MVFIYIVWARVATELYGYEAKAGKDHVTSEKYSTTYCDYYEAPCLRVSLSDEARANIEALYPNLNNVPGVDVPFASLHKVSIAFLQNAKTC